MGNPLRIKTLASAVGLALVGLTFQPSVQARAMVKSAAPAQSEAQQSYFINFAEAGLVSYRGGVEGLAATAPRATQSRRLDARSPAAVAYSEYLQSARLGHIAAIQGALGHDIAVTHHYGVTHNGIAADLTASEAAAIATMPGVVSVKLAGFEQLTTYRGPRFIGADTIWDGSNTPTHVGTKGEGIVAAILDGGTNSTHPSFANDTACGFSAANPKLAIKVDCHSTNAAGECTGTNPEANPGYGHGVHTSSTVAGNTIDNTVTPAPALPDGVTMSGVAPCATIHHYKVCATNTCASSAIKAGIDNAILDGADVLNFSISGGTSPWTDNDRGFLDAVDSDIFVAASAGNNTQTDPTVIGRVNHRGPWVMTVAASTQDQIIGPSLSITGPGTPPDEISGIPLNPGSTTPPSSTPNWTGKPVKSYPANIEGCTDSGGIASGAFTGSVAVLRRGTCAFTEKISNAYAAGAELVVIANNQPGSISMDTTGAPAVPAYSISSVVTGDALLAFLAANPSSATGNVDAIAVGYTQGDVLADFSYRGPTPGNLADLTKPDITGPGVDIYAATDPTSGQYEFMSGTSMSGPHVAGAAALVRAVQPDWTVTEVKSAMMTTTKTGGFQEDGTTPWNIDDVGSGRVDLTKAALAGFTMDESVANFIAANPSGGSINVKDLNLPALRNLNCTPDCSFTRKVTNRLSTSATWNTSFEATVGGIGATVSPASFTLAPGATQELTITVHPPYKTEMPAIGFGFIHFNEANGQSPQQHFSVAIKGTGGAEPEPDDVIFADGFDGTDVGSTPFTWQLDDGSYESAIGWTDEDGNIEYASLWLNRFSPDASDFPLLLENVEVMWPSNNTGSITGKQVTILVYFDADGDGDPSNAELLTSVSGVAGGIDTFQSFPVEVEVPSAGDVYIGFEDSWADGGFTPPLYPGALDTDSGTSNRAYIVANDSGDTPDKENLGANDYVETIEEASGNAFSGNWMIRGNGQASGGKRVELKN
ncbi:MAG: S8 family serine peptidase [Xanthomonadales bacterium]|nr:S8 family serine peptidase [Xanthomonadales bacterium]